MKKKRKVRQGQYWPRQALFNRVESATASPSALLNSVTIPCKMLLTIQAADAADRENAPDAQAEQKPAPAAENIPASQGEGEAGFKQL